MNEEGQKELPHDLLRQIHYKIMLFLAFLATIIMGIIEINKTDSFDVVFIILLMLATLIVAGFTLYVIVMLYNIRKPRSFFWYGVTAIIALYVVIFLFSSIVFLLGNVGFWPWKNENFAMYQLYIFFLDQTLKGVLSDIPVSLPFKFPSQIRIADDSVVFNKFLTAWQFFVRIFVLAIITKIAWHVYKKVVMKYRSAFSSSDER